MKTLDKHKKYCDQYEAVRPEMPEPGTLLTFNHHYRSMRVPFIVYAVFESFTKPVDTCQSDPSKSYTNQYQKHTPSSLCYCIKCFDDDLYSHEPVTFTIENKDDDVSQIFVDTLEEHIKEIQKRFFKYQKIVIFTKTDERKYK